MANEEENSPLNGDEDVIFYFYYELVKKLILKRQDVEYKFTLSSWLKVLQNTKNKTVRNEYIKLMLLVLQNDNQLCPFKDYPPETIDPLENGVIEIARKLRQGEGTATCIGANETSNQKASYPTISTAVSQNKRQYAACQVIPNVGVQCYFAFSDDHLYNWNIPSVLAVPPEGPHTRDVDWERAMAGIHLKRQTNPSAENLDSNENAKIVKNEKEDDGTVFSTSVSGASKKKSKDVPNEDPELCKVMYLEQQMRGVTEVFEWNDASLLTGEIILGAEMGSDRKVDAQVKTQPEIDKEVGYCYDKLYPGDFRIQVEPSFLSDVIRQKTYVDMETGDKKTVKEQSDEKSKKIQDNKNPGKMCGEGCSATPTKCRQRAGQESSVIMPSPDGDTHSVDSCKFDLRRKISDISSDLAALNHSYESRHSKNMKNRRHVEPNETKTCPQNSTASSSSTVEMPSRNKIRQVEYRNEERPTHSKLHTDLLDFQRQIKMAEDCRNNVPMRGNNNNNCKNLTNIDLSDSTETSSDV